MLPIRSEYALATKTYSFYESQGWRVLSGDDDLKTTDVERRHTPSGEHAECFGCDSSSTGTRNDAASELTHLVFSHHDRDFPEVRIVFNFGNHEVEQFAFGAVFLEQLCDTGRVHSR